MMTKKPTWALPGIVIVGAIALASACNNGNGDAALPNCPDDTTTGSGGATGAGGGATTTTTTGSSTGGGAPITETPTPQQVNARLHGCRKLRYETLGAILRDRGVDLDETTPNSAGLLYTNGQDAFSVPKPDSRRGEKDGHTTASAMKMFDIFVQAAPQIINNISDPQLAPACAVNGHGINMFDPVDGSCVEEAVSCLIGSLASEDHMVLCNLILDKADSNDPADVALKQRIAVATLMSAAHSCE